MDLDNLDKTIAFDEEDLAIKNVYIKYVKRNGAKCITLVEGLESDLNIKAIIKTFKKRFTVAMVFICSFNNQTNKLSNF